MIDLDEIKGSNGEGQEPSSSAAGLAVRRLRRIRTICWVLVLIMTMVFAGYAGWRTFGPRELPPTAKEVGQALIKNEFALTDHQGRKVSGRDYRGKWQLVFFGFTYCPDICPTTLAMVARVMDILGAEAEGVTPLFITVDPDRDTPEVLAAYVSAFHPRMVGLTGSAAEIKSTAKAFRVYYAKAPQKDAPDGYLMGHSGLIYLMTPDGTYEAAFSHDRDTPETIAAALRKRLKKN